MTTPIYQCTVRFLQNLCTQFEVSIFKFVGVITSYNSIVHMGCLAVLAVTDSLCWVLESDSRWGSNLNMEGQARLLYCQLCAG